MLVFELSWWYMVRTAWTVHMHTGWEHAGRAESTVAQQQRPLLSREGCILLFLFVPALLSACVVCMLCAQVWECYSQCGAKQHCGLASHTSVHGCSKCRSYLR